MPEPCQHKRRTQWVDHRGCFHHTCLDCGIMLILWDEDDDEDDDDA